MVWLQNCFSMWKFHPHLNRFPGLTLGIAMALGHAHRLRAAAVASLGRRADAWSAQRKTSAPWGTSFWWISWDFMGLYGDFMGFYGGLLGSNGILCDFMVILWDFMGFYGILWWFYGILWDFMVILWDFMVVYWGLMGFTRPGQHTENYGKSRCLMGKSTISTGSFIYIAMLVYRRINQTKSW